ncbi:MAG: ribosome recycling factor [Algisphaera sp.]
MELDNIQMEAEEAMQKGVDHVKNEMKGVRTGRANPAMVEFVKVECYGAESDLRSVAMISAPESNQLLIKPFDPSTASEIAKSLEKSNLGMTPVVDAKQIRLSIPSLSGDRRKQLMVSVKQMGEHAKITIRNARRDANKAIETAGKDKESPVSEDDVKGAKTETQDLLKKYEGIVEKLVAEKMSDIETV